MTRKFESCGQRRRSVNRPRIHPRKQNQNHPNHTIIMVIKTKRCFKYEHTFRISILLVCSVLKRQRFSMNWLTNSSSSASSSAVTSLCLLLEDRAPCECGTVGRSVDRTVGRHIGRSVIRESFSKVEERNPW